MKHPSYNRTCEAPPTRWRVVDRNCNYSAFSGYQWTYSNWSALVCLDCGTRWRSKASYVSTIKDATKQERLA